MGKERVTGVPKKGLRENAILLHPVTQLTSLICLFLESLQFCLLEVRELPQFEHHFPQVWSWMRSKWPPLLGLVWCLDCLWEEGFDWFCLFHPALKVQNLYQQCCSHFCWACQRQSHRQVCHYLHDEAAPNQWSLNCWWNQQIVAPLWAVFWCQQLKQYWLSRF